MEDLGVDRRIILKWILKKCGWEGVDWIHLAQDRGQIDSFLNTIMNFCDLLTVRLDINE